MKSVAKGDRGFSVPAAGVPQGWTALLKFLPSSGKMLDYGSWQGIAARWRIAGAPSCPVEFAHTSATQLAQAKAIANHFGLPLVSRPMFPIEGTWDTIVLAAPDQTEALQMLATQGASCLKNRGQLFVVDRQPRKAALAGAFSEVVELAQGSQFVFQCRGPRPGAEILPWRELSYTVKGINVELASLPGVFSPTALDKGSQILLETARILPGARVLDLACGYGALGIGAAKMGAGEVVFADDCLIALRATGHNLDRHGLVGEKVHCHHPREIRGKFACILCNPPFHSDYGVARSFIEFAQHRLEEGGWFYLVVKKPDWYRRKLISVFGGCHVTESNGYHVLAVQQRHSMTDKVKKTTRKHQRRQEATLKRRGKVD